jgi:hypothetical protein
VTEGAECPRVGPARGNRTRDIGKHVRFDVPAAPTAKATLLRDVTPCNLVFYKFII